MKYLLLMAITLLLSTMPLMAQVSDDAIEKDSTPAVTPLVVSERVLYDRLYRRVDGDLAFYDAPNGNLTNNMGTGFNFVTVAREENGWSTIGSNRWMPNEALSTDVLISRFTGVLLPQETPLPYTVAWTLKHLRASRTAGGEASQQNPFMYRYTLVYLYDFVEVDGFRWYQIGKDQWVHQFNVAKITPIERPEEINTEKWVSVDLYEQTLIAYEGETPVFATLISSGLPQWSTNEGIFNVYVRYERTLMSGAYNRPDFYYLEEVPYTMYFDGDIGLHGTYWHDGFGYRRSHGCVNLSITDARWLYQWSADVRDFTVENSPDLAVLVYSSDTYK